MLARLLSVSIEKETRTFPLRALLGILLVFCPFLSFCFFLWFCTEYIHI